LADVFQRTAFGFFTQYQDYCHNQQHNQRKHHKDIDNANVYLNTDINSIEELKIKYAIHQNAKNFFIYSHAFVDAVKYFETLYSDYYTWLYETLILLSKKIVFQLVKRSTSIKSPIRLVVVALTLLSPLQGIVISPF